MRRQSEVVSDQGLVVGRALDRISDYNVRSEAMLACLDAIERWRSPRKKPERVVRGNVIEMFPRRTT